MTEVRIEHPSVLHLTWAIQAIQNELQDVPPFSVDRQTRLAEICQLQDMKDRRTKRRPDAQRNAGAA